MKASTKVYIVFIAVTLAVGALAAALTMGSMEDYGNLPKPSFAPPGWLFPIVWTILYVLMAVAAARVWMSGSEYRDKAIILYAVQLTVNFFWTIIFFNFKAYTFAFVWLLLLLALVIAAAVLFAKSDKAAGWLLAPYVIWLVFAQFVERQGVALVFQIYEFVYLSVRVAGYIYYRRLHIGFFVQPLKRDYRK